MRFNRSDMFGIVGSLVVFLLLLLAMLCQGVRL